ncbi:hypothetical protein [Gracilibacillus sp. JCM 18860]|uniref:hypothetical protein n=1 Tax=Gracilibacillus sp. JCM 18860 TaxID=1306159 RepID=UPI000AE2F41C
MKKIINVFLLSALMILLLAACSNDEASKEKQETEDGKVVLSGLITKHPLTKDLADMEWLQEVEDRAGVEIKWEEVTADWDQKKGGNVSGW